MQPLSRRDREALRHRDEILTAAEQVFAEKGFHNTTMEDIAQTSEFAIGTLYKHFKSKEAIFLGLMEDRLTGYIDGMGTVIAQEKPFNEILDEFLYYYAEFGDQHRAFLRLFHNTSTSADWHKGDVRDCIRPNMEAYFGHIRFLMEKGVREGHLLPLDVNDLTAFVLGCLQGFFFATLESETSGIIREKIPVIRSLLLTGAGAGTDARLPLNQL